MYRSCLPTKDNGLVRKHLNSNWISPALEDIIATAGVPRCTATSWKPCPPWTLVLAEVCAVGRADDDGWLGWD